MHMCTCMCIYIFECMAYMNVYTFIFTNFRIMLIMIINISLSNLLSQHMLISMQKTYVNNDAKCIDFYFA